MDCVPGLPRTLVGPMQKIPLFASLFITTFCLAPIVLAQKATLSEAPLSDRIVTYTMDVALDPEERTIQGSQLITWRNPDSVPVNELQFHLYLNAFKNEQSTFMRESGGSHRGFRAEGENIYGGVDISRIHRLTGVAPDASPLQQPNIEEDLTDKMRFIQPDDGNIHDETVMSVRLDRPVGPGETVTLGIEFTSTMPKISARTGWERDEDGNLFFFAGQWFPKLGVYEIPGQRYHPADAPSGKWSTHQFHANSEFYADFGVYDVTITVPDVYTVGASGVLREETVTEGVRTVNYVAEDVHDFAWTAGQSFVEYHDTWRSVDIRLLLQRVHDGQQGRHFQSAKLALEAFDEWVGPYPYTTLTLVDGIGGSNGMEYPTLITCGTFYGIPSWVRVPLELVTIHEFGHQYFYGMLASNEAEEAWLDEGMNSYLETRIMDTFYEGGSVLDIPGLRIDDGQIQRLSYTKSTPSRGALFTKSWEYDSGEFSNASYTKPATVMNSLERYLGWETMQQFLKEYYSRWAFRHPTTRDLQDVVEDVAGEDLGWFFDQYVYGTAVVDYELYRIQNTRIIEDDSDADSTRYNGYVLVHRLEDGTFPQTVQVKFRDGSIDRRVIDGQDEWTRINFYNHAGIEEAFVDPDNEVWLDVNRLNNRRSTTSAAPLPRKVQFKAAVLLQQLYFVLSGII